MQYFTRGKITQKDLVLLGKKSQKSKKKVIKKIKKSQKIGLVHFFSE